MIANERRGNGMDTPTVPIEDTLFVNDYTSKVYRATDDTEDVITYEDYDACVRQRLIRMGLICFQIMSHYSPV